MAEMTIFILDGVLNNGKFHAYHSEKVMCNTVNSNCNVDKVFEGLRHYSAPGKTDGIPVNNYGRALLHKGFVDRTVVDGGSQIKITTYGEGTGRFPVLNSSANDFLWTGVDEEIIRYVRSGGL